MRHIFCALLICGAVQASAQGTFLVKTSDKPGDVTDVQPRGQVNWLAQPMMIDGIKMVATSRVRDVTTISFDEFGTAYAFCQTTGEPVRVLPISARNMGAEGNFEFQGFPYVIFQGRVMGIKDNIVLSSVWRKLGNHKLALNRTVPAGIWAGGAATTQMVVSALFNYQIVYTALGAAVAAGVGKYLYDVRHDFMKSHLDLGYDMNWFTRKVITNVESYEIIEAEPPLEAGVVNGVYQSGHLGKAGDVLLHVRKGGKIEMVLMSQVVRDEKVTYRHTNCIRLLEEIRGKGK